LQGGDKYLVRFLLQKRADRSKVGYYHYTKPLSSPDMKGFTDIAELIRMGL
jgi:hypothetical protein